MGSACQPFARQGYGAVVEGPHRRLGRPPGRSGQSTRARILAAARERFGRAGYGPTSVGQLAEDAGITPAAVYRYFDSKASLYQETVRDAVGELVPRYREAVAGAPTAAAGLVALVLVSADLHEQDPSLAEFLSSLIPEMRRSPDLAALVADEPAEVTELVTELVERARDEGTLGGDADIEAIIGMFLACTNGLSLWIATYDTGQSGAVIRAFARLLERGLGA